MSVVCLYKRDSFVKVWGEKFWLVDGVECIDLGVEWVLHVADEKVLATSADIELVVEPVDNPAAPLDVGIEVDYLGDADNGFLVDLLADGAMSPIPRCTRSE